MTGRPPRRPLGVAVLTAALALTGCAGLPDRTSVQAGRQVDADVDDGIRVTPQGPVAGEDATSVVLGFLRASVTVDDDPTVGREFLAPSGVAQWASRGVAIHENGVVPDIRVSGGVAHVSVPVTGALDSDGHYRDLPPGSTTRLSLPLTKVGGEWRIAGGLRTFGAMMSRSDFARYGGFAIPYATPDGTSFVDDHRWFLMGPGLETRLARAVVASAPAYLQGAVTTGAPDYTDIVGAVSVSSGTATVTLSDRASGADDAARRLLWTRFVTTLTQVRGVDSVQLEVGDARLTADGLPDRPLLASDVSLPAPRLRNDVAVVRTGTTLTPVAPSSIGPEDNGRPTRLAVPGIGPLPRLAPTWYHLALAADGSEIAAVGGDDAELHRWRGGTEIAIPPFATRLTRPAYDRTGTLWVGGRTPAGERVFVLDTTAAGTRPTVPTALEVPWLDGRRIVALEVADDGQRVVVVSVTDRGTGTRVDVAGVVRAAGRPVSLASPREVASVLVGVTDATWTDPSTVAVIGRRATDAANRVVVVPLNEPVHVLAEVRDGRTITSLGSERSIAVVTSGNQVLLRSGNGFSPVMSSRELDLPGR